ncbi:MAG: flagellar hook assembly protein FlgD [Caulobacterales bacterium]
MTAPVAPTTPTTPATGTQATINTGLASVANNYQTFLSLLTTQLKNQDPLSPLDTNQFTQQLTQMTGVEQQLLSNQLLQQLVNQQGLTQAAGLIGQTVTAPGAKSTDPQITGVVTGVQEVNGTTVLTVGKNQVPLSAVTSIATTSPTAPAAAG